MKDSVIKPGWCQWAVVLVTVGVVVPILMLTAIGSGLVQENRMNVGIVTTCGANDVVGMAGRLLVRAPWALIPVALVLLVTVRRRLQIVVQSSVRFLALSAVTTCVLVSFLSLIGTVSLFALDDIHEAGQFAFFFFLPAAISTALWIVLARKLVLSPHETSVVPRGVGVTPEAGGRESWPRA